MVNYCRVFGCHNRSDRERDKHFYRLPEIITREGQKTLELSTERRRLWLAKLNQDFSGKNLKNIRICSDHFISGKRAELYEKDSPDWAPTVNMCPTPLPNTPSPLIASNRFQRCKARTEKSDVARTLLTLWDMETEPSADPELNEMETGTASQTDIDAVTLNAMSNELSHLQSDNDELRKSQVAQTPFCREYFMGDDEKVKYFSGLGSFAALMTLFNYLESFLPPKASLSTFQCFMLVLMKLRLSLSNIFLSYQFNISTATVSRIFSDYVDVMFIRMKPFVHWPDREILRKTMPMQFRKHFGITPQGAISFISNSWGGRTSDKHLTEHCGFLDMILPGDLVLADRGFDIAESVGTLCAQVKIPAFTRGKSQMSPIDLETSHKLANVRIHVERVIGLTRQKYTILNSTLPIEFLETRLNGDDPLIDKIVLICRALVNLCESIVNFD